jgi:phosphinothricin acetyltransferase
MLIRVAEQNDLDAITAIYNEVLLTSTAIYRDIPVTVEDRTEWWNLQREKGYPVIVAEADGKVLGFASFGDFRTWPGYRFTVEGTIHLTEAARRKGTGTMLLKEIIALAKGLGKHMLIAGVDAENAASLAFLTKMGFEQSAHLREVGYKFGRYLDLILLQYDLSRMQ